MFVFIPGSIPPVRFGPAGTDPAEISIPAVTYIDFYYLLETAIGCQDDIQPYQINIDAGLPLVVQSEAKIFYGYLVVL